MRSILLIPLLIVISPLLGQNFISSSQFDEDELREFLTDTINQKRAKKQLQELFYDETLEAAAYEQAMYLMKKGSFEHKQENSKFKTLTDRVGYFGGRYAGLGENIFAMQTAESANRRGGRSKEAEVKEYGDIITLAIQAWEAKKESNENLYDEDFYRIGMTVVYDSVNKELGIVAVMGTEPYPQRAGLKAQEINAFKPYDRSACDKLFKEYPATAELLGSSVEIVDQQVWLRNVDQGFLEKLLVSGSDAIAADVICKDQFPCNSGNKLFPGSSQDGYVLKPIKKLNYSGRLQANEKGGVDLNLGKLPSAFESQQCEANVLLVKEGILCSTAPYNRFGGKNISLLNIPFQFDFKKDSIASPSWVDTLNFSFSAASPEKEILNKLRSLLTYYDNTEPDVKSASVSIYYSPVKAKKEKAAKWKSLIQNELESYSSETIIFSTSEKVAWNEYRDFASNKVYSLEAKKLDSLELMDYLSKEYEKEGHLRSFIDSLNKINLKVVLKNSWKKEQNDNLGQMYLYFINKNRPAEALKVQQKVIVQKNTEAQKSLLKKEVPLKKDYSALANNQLLLQIETGKFDDTKGKTRKQSFGEILFADGSNEEVLYNQLLSALQEWSKNVKDAQGVNEWLKSYSRLRQSNHIPDSNLQMLLLNYHILVADHYYENGKFEERKKELENVNKILSSKKIRETEANFYAEYLMFQLQLPTAIKILKPFAFKEKPTKETLENILSLSIYSYNELAEKEKSDLYQKFADLYPKEFCKLFDAENMGVQTLKVEEVKKLYCKTCGK